MSDNSSNSSGIGLAGALFVLFVLFVGLKLTSIIAWSWWWVTAPLWAPLTAVAVVAAVVFVGAVLLDAFSKLRRRSR